MPLEIKIKINMQHVEGFINGWAGAVMRKPLAILEIFRTDGRTDGPTRQGVESRVRD